MIAPTESAEIERDLIGNSEATRRVDADIACAARSRAKVLITGETGVGKEIVARLIHRRSGADPCRFYTLNCAGVPDSLLESELFGHARGSFTGAYRDKIGLLELASGGTIFLDEIGEMSSRMQAALLRFLDSGEIRRVGAAGSAHRVDTRIIAATHRDLSALNATGGFRSDLYFRLNVVRVRVAPLRDRTEDIPAFIDHFTGVRAGGPRAPLRPIAPRAMDALFAYPWPGNVRELKHLLERLSLRETGAPIEIGDLPPEYRHPTSARRPAPVELVAAPATPGSEDLAALMFVEGQSFWGAVHARFMSRDLTRQDLRELIHLGLERTNGSYRALVHHFNMPETDYKRFLSFLREHDCHLPFQPFRRGAGAAPARLTAKTS